MMKHKTALRVTIIMMLTVGTILILLPFLKTAMLSYLIETTVIHETSNVPSNSNAEKKREWVQPPTLGDVLKAYTTDSEIFNSGRVVVPDVAINAPVFSDLTNENLLYGSGMMFPSRDPNKDNMVLIGHHISDKGLLFGSLSSVKVGSFIYLEYLKHYYQYQINEVTMINDTQVEVMDNRGKAEITLITCDRPSFTTHRILVRGQLVADDNQAQVQKQMERAQMKQTSKKSKTMIFLIKFKWIILMLVFVLVVSTYIVRKFI